MHMSLIHDYGFLANEHSNLSLPGVYSYGDLVKHPVHGHCVVSHEEVKALDPKKGVEIYVHNGTTHASGFTYVTTISVFKNKMVAVPYTELTRFTLKDIMRWRHPSGEWMHGKNNFFGQALRYGLFLGLSIYGATQLHHGAGWLVLVIAPLAVIGVMLHGVVRNFDGKQM